MKILAIESSCDETAAAVIENGTDVLSNVVVSQVDIFAAYGGVIPEVAARSHLEAILPVIHQALIEAGITKYSQAFLAHNPELRQKLPQNYASNSDIDAIAVTHTPGLVGSLLIGTLTARTLAILWSKPLYAVHHLKSHIYANWLHANNDQVSESKGSECTTHSITSQKTKSKSTKENMGDYCETFNSNISSETKSERKLNKQNDSPIKTGAGVGLSRDIAIKSFQPRFPLLSLIISGGHTQIIYTPTHNQFEIIGTTRDDAVGECFDKVAKILGLPYPGGPAIANCAQHGDPHSYHLPHPKVSGLDFSFSGLKTAVLRSVQTACALPITTPSHELKKHLSNTQKTNFAASFEATACDILLEKLESALEIHPEIRSIVFAGGVSANQALRLKAQKRFQNSTNNTNYLPLYFPDPRFTGDNAAMVGAAAYYEILSGTNPTDPYNLNISPRTTLKNS